MSVAASSDPQVVAMKRATEVSAVLKLRLVDLRSHYPEGPVVAVEGEIDKVVYSHWISRIHKEASYEFFVCNGKRNARQLCAVLARDRSGLSADIYFIVDRDFDNLEGFPEASPVMMLDRYSFENYLVEPDVLDQVLRLGFPCNGHPALRESLLATFCRDYEEFLRISAPVNLQIFKGRRLKMDIDSAIPKGIADMARVDIGKVDEVARTADDIMPLPRSLTNEEATRLQSEFETLSGRERYRGKFALKFFRTWLDVLIVELKTGGRGVFARLDSNEKKILHEELGIGAMARSSPMPSDMAAFVHRVFAVSQDDLSTV